MKILRQSQSRWLPDLDLNQDKQIQSLLCYRYTIGQTAPENPTLFAGRVKFGLGATIDLTC
jgi:hypothetical protein